jgi:uncharacterized protein (DUF983 family)
MSGVAGVRLFTDDYLTDTGSTRSNQKGQPGLAKAALFGLCPNCAAKTLFSGLTRFSEHCKTCGLDYTGFNVGDGPAALLTMAIGAFIIVLALIVDTIFRPPFWVHALIWVPFTAAMVVLLLRFTKAALLILEHHNRAGEGKMDIDQ